VNLMEKTIDKDKEWSPSKKIKGEYGISSPTSVPYEQDPLKTKKDIDFLKKKIKQDGSLNIKLSDRDIKDLIYLFKGNSKDVFNFISTNNQHLVRSILDHYQGIVNENVEPNSKPLLKKIKSLLNMDEDSESDSDSELPDIYTLINNIKKIKQAAGIKNEEKYSYDYIFEEIYGQSSKEKEETKEEVKAVSVPLQENEEDEQEVVIQQPCYISKLNEHMLYMCFAYLDASSFASGSVVCLFWQKLYQKDYSNSIFKQYCFNTWDKRSLFKTSKSFLHSFVTWKDMYQRRPRLLFGGAYISEVQYIRSGVSDMSLTQPVHQVKYYRCLRFYENGRAVSIFCNKRPRTMAKKLKDDAVFDMSKGSWSFLDGILLLDLTVGQTTYEYQYEVQSSEVKPNTQLTLIKYGYRMNQAEVGKQLNSGTTAKIFKFYKVPDFLNELKISAAQLLSIC